jgi:hypothetical protein
VLGSIPELSFLDGLTGSLLANLFIDIQRRRFALRILPDPHEQGLWVVQSHHHSFEGFKEKLVVSSLHGGPIDVRTGVIGRLFTRWK